MARWLDTWQRKLTQKTLEGAVTLNRWLGVRGSIQFGQCLAQVSNWSIFPRRRLASNYRQVGIVPTEDVLDRYFSIMSSWIGFCLSIYEHGLTELGIHELIEFDESICHLDEAHARGKGVVLAAPHIFGHDIAAGIVNLRHPVHAIIRESKDPTRGQMKKRWYDTLGLQTVFRARHSSVVNDTLSYVRLLRGGNILGITPDLPVSSDKGLPVWIFGRKVHLSPGAILLAQRSKAALVTCFGERLPARPGDLLPRVRLSFTKPVVYTPAKGQRERSLHEGLQQWTQVLENYLLSRPEFWMFWLDKRWTRIIQTPVRECA